jgi:hypothetical protein
MATELDKLFKGFSIKEIEDIMFTAADGVKKLKKKIVFPGLNQEKKRHKQRIAN